MNKDFRQDIAGAKAVISRSTIQGKNTIVIEGNQKTKKQTAGGGYNQPPLSCEKQCRIYDHQIIKSRINTVDSSGYIYKHGYYANVTNALNIDIDTEVLYYFQKKDVQ